MTHQQFETANQLLFNELGYMIDEDRSAAFQNAYDIIGLRRFRHAINVVKLDKKIHGGYHKHNRLLTLMALMAPKTETSTPLHR